MNPVIFKEFKKGRMVKGTREQQYIYKINDRDIAIRDYTVLTP